MPLLFPTTIKCMVRLRALAFLVLKGMMLGAQEEREPDQFPNLLNRWSAHSHGKAPDSKLYLFLSCVRKRQTHLYAFSVLSPVFLAIHPFTAF
jgi:hypothetical protein